MGPPFVRNGTGGNPMALPELNAVVSAVGPDLGILSSDHKHLTALPTFSHTQTHHTHLC
jgi:hypothetical protein